MFCLDELVCVSIVVVVWFRIWLWVRLVDFWVKFVFIICDFVV